jgi:hypothetical protein
MVLRIEALVMLGLVGLAGCATTGGFPDVVEPRDLQASVGAPHISRIRDAGISRLPARGAWRGSSDGVASPGEILVIEGSSFGKQPTVTIGGRATSIVARGAGGAIMARVPHGVASGVQPVEVSHAKGRATHSVEVRRLAVVVHADHVYFLAIDTQGAHPLPAPIAVPGARLLRLSPSGGMAYVVATRPDGDKLIPIDLCVAQPRLLSQIALTHRVTQMAAAEDAARVAFVGEGRLTMALTDDERVPAPFPAIDLPKEVRGVRAFELSPDGKVAAFLLAEGNRLAALDVDPPPSASLINVVDLLPGEKLPLVRDLGFSADGDTLWVVSGNNAQTLPALQPTRLTAVKIVAAEAANPPPRGKARLLSVWRTQSVPGAAAPIKLAIARGQPLASGTTIRMPPERAAVFVSSVKDALFELGEVQLDSQEGARLANKLWQAPPPGMMVRGELSGAGGPMFTSPQVLSAVDLTPDAQRIAATAARVAQPVSVPVQLEFGVVTAPVFGQGAPVYVGLGPLAPRELKPPFLIGELRIQP